MSDENIEPSSRHLLVGLRAEALMAHGMPNTPVQFSDLHLAGFEFQGQIGRGGMGAVYLARQIGLDRQVAVKQVAPELQHNPKLMAHLEREALTMAKLRHENIVAVYQFERLEDGSAVIVMEYIEGENLRCLINSHPQGLPLDQALDLFRGIAQALTAAHNADIVHRDMKPENVLVDSRGLARVTDFGLAEPINLQYTGLTLTGSTVGTIDYLAPEQFKSSEPDARSDLYALGVILYELLTGTTPRGNFESPRELRSAIPVRISEATMRALKPNPNNRFPSTQDFLTEIERARAQKSSRRWWIPMIGIGVLAASLILHKKHRSSLADAPSTHRPFQAEPRSNPSPWQDLLHPVSLENNTISGGWQRDRGYLTTNHEICILGLARNVSGSYEIRTSFVRLSGEHSLAIFFSANNSVGTVGIDCWGEHRAGVQTIGGKDLRKTRGFFFKIENGRQYELLVRVEPEQVTVVIDGQEMSVTRIENQELGVPFLWGWYPGENGYDLSIGSFNSPTRFQSVQWRALPAVQN